MQAQAAEFSGFRRKIPLLFGARNKRVAGYWRVRFAG